MNLVHRDLGNDPVELALLNAPFEENGWDKALAAIAEATRTTSVHLLAIGGPGFIGLSKIHGPAGGFTSHLANAHLHGPCNWRVSSVGAAMSIQTEVDYAQYRARNDTADYDDIVADMDIPFGCQSAILQDEQQFFGLSLLRSRRDGRTTPELLRQFARIRAQLARAVQMQIALDDELADTILGRIEPRCGMTFLLDRHGSVCAESEAGAELRQSGSPFQRGTLGLALAEPRDDARFQRALAHVFGAGLVGSDEPLVADLIVGGEADPRRRWRLVICRLPNGDHGLGFAPFAIVTAKPL